MMCYAMGINMDFSEVVFTRRAIRKYKNTPISDEILQRLFQAIQAAPSANNRQPVKFVFVKKQELRQKIVSRPVIRIFFMMHRF